MEGGMDQYPHERPRERRGLSIKDIEPTDEYKLITGPSGSSLYVKKDSNVVSILEPKAYRFRESGEWAQDKKNMYHLVAVVNEQGALQFEVRTRKKVLFGIKEKKHPDLYAGLFVREAIEYFDEIGTPMVSYQAQWDYYEDMYKQYQQLLYENNFDNLKAVKGTWDAQLVSRYGFTQVEKDDIKTAGGQYGNRILVTFHRVPQQNPQEQLGR